MRRVNVRRGAEAHDLEHRRHRPLARGQDSAGDEDFHVWPHRWGKDGGKDANDTGERDRQGEPGYPFRMKSTRVALPINFNSNFDKWTKSS